MESLSEFLESGLSLAVYHGYERAYESREPDLRALVTYLSIHVAPNAPITLYDKYVGRAAALLMTLISPVRVLAGLISDGGRRVLDEAGIEWRAQSRAQFLMGAASDGMCKWEKLAAGKTAEELLRELGGVVR